MSDITDWWEFVATVPCLACQKAPVQLHHARSGSMVDNGYLAGGAQKPSDWFVLPICLNHHTGGEGIHSIGVRTWETRFGSQLMMLQGLMLITGVNVFHQADQTLPTHWPSQVNDFASSVGVSTTTYARQQVARSLSPTALIGSLSGMDAL